MTVVGQSIPRSDALDKVTGKALYPADLNMPGQAYMKIKFAGRPHAIVRAVHTERAEALDGVIAVFTAKDVPVNEYGLGMPDQPVLCGPGSTKPFADRVRFVGDQVALVVAESEEIAARGRDLIEVDYEDLPVVTDVREAMKAGAVLVHPDRESNIFTHRRIRHGDVINALAKADVVVKSEYLTPVQEHAYLQPEAGLAFMDEEGRVAVKVAGQWVHEEQEQIAHSLNLPMEQVRVIHPEIGGAFGGREDMSIQIVLGLAVLRLHQRGTPRPVKIVWNREESIIGHHKRHIFSIRSTWGATREGKIVAAEVEVVQDGGAYCYTSNKVLGNATLMCSGPYNIPNVWVDSYSVYTNNIPGGAFRGFGGPQGAFAAEMQIEKLARELGLDPVEIRMRNMIDQDSIMSVGSPMPDGVTVRMVAESCAVKAGWTQTGQGWKKPQEPWQLGWANGAGKNRRTGKTIRRGIGFAAGYKNIGFSFGAPEECWATVELHGTAEIEKVVLRHAAAEVGQGSHTALLQIVADAVGVPFGRVEGIFADTALTDNSGSVSASRMTFMAGNSIIGAAKLALEKWQAEERPAVATYQYKPPRTTPLEPETGKATPNFAYGYMAEAVIVEVDTDTGQVEVVGILSSNDVGKAINPQQVEGQIEGALIQALGYAVHENFVQKDGYIATKNFSTYLIPGILDVPEKVAIDLMEYPIQIGPYGARGIGEMPLIPFAPAVCAAVYDAIGVWFDTFPLTPDRVLKGLGKI